MHHPHPKSPPPPLLKSLALLLPWVAPYRHKIALTLLAIIVIAAALLSLGLGIAVLVDQGLHSPTSLNKTIGFCLIAALLLAVGSYGRVLLVNQLAERIIADMRQAMFTRLLTLPPTWFEDTPRGDIIARFTSDSVLIQTVLASHLSMAARNILLLVGGMAMLVLTNPGLTVLILLLLPLVVVPVVIIGRRLRQQSRQAQTSLAQLAVEIDESLAAIDDIAIFGRQDYMARRFAEACQTNYRIAKQQVHSRGLLSGLVIFFGFAVIALIFWLGGRALISEDMTPGALSAFAFYAALVATAIAALTDMGGELQRAMAAFQRIQALLDTQPPALPRRRQPFPDLSKLSPTPMIAFDKVSFCYPSRKTPALSNISFAIAHGEKVAIVGRAGAGKTTLFKLVLGLLAADRGRISIGGVAVDALAGDALRQHIAVVPQRPALFSASIKDNIGFASAKATPADIEAAAKTAGMHAFIAGLPQGYATPIGEKGVQLSGGQRAQIAIARALLRDAPILLLDEATAALDAATEKEIQRGLNALLKQRTSLVIAHRLATVMDCDRIIVLEEGRLLASGSHQQLLAKSAVYQNLASLQLLGKLPNP